MSDVLPDKCGCRASRAPAHCRGATFKSGFPHNSSLFPRTTSLKRAKTSWYNCLFTNWARGKKFMIDNSFPFKKHKQQHLDLWPTHPCFFFLSRRTLSPSSATIASWFQHHTHKIFTKFAAKCDTHTHAHTHTRVVLQALSLSLYP